MVDALAITLLDLIYCTSLDFIINGLRADANLSSNPTIGLPSLAESGHFSALE